MERKAVITLWALVDAVNCHRPMVTVRYDRRACRGTLVDCGTSGLLTAATGVGNASQYIILEIAKVKTTVRQKTVF